MKKYPLAGIGYLILAVVFFYLIENGDHPFRCLVLPAVFFVVGTYHIIPNKREPYEGPEESLESEFASFKEFIGEKELQGIKGGYFGEKSTTTSKALFPTLLSVGVVPEDKVKRCSFLVREQLNRVLENFHANHLTSYESRDSSFIFDDDVDNETVGKLGGAVVVDVYFTIYAFVGYPRFPELIAETFVCWVAWKKEKMTLDNLKFICERRKDNPHLQKFLEYASKQ